MKFKYKKYLFLLNDITNILLKKELETREIEAVHRLRTIITALSVLLFVSLAVNFFLLLK